jgi:Arc/MetJ-type ribon-helix-helix transcriptional regulator
MKERASFTFDRETLKIIDELVKSGKYRNRSHAVEESIKLLKDREDESSSLSVNKKGGKNE